MEEAETLADKIVIVKHGQVATCGDTLALKSKFGDGAHITVTCRYIYLFISFITWEEYTNDFKLFFFSDAPGSLKAAKKLVKRSISDIEIEE